MAHHRPPLTIEPAEPRGALRFTRRMQLTIYATVAAIWATGVAWLVLHFFARQQGEFGLVPHPLESWSLKAHGAAGFASLLLAGALLSSHVLPAWRRRRRPPSGVIVATILALLIVSGYLLYYAGGEALRNGTAIVHWAIGLVLPVALLLHMRHRKRLARRRPPLR